jgi:hypothetical protein
VNVITRSGSNDLNGTLYGFLRSRSMDARNVFAPQNEPAPAYDREQFGGSIGEPNRAIAPSSLRITSTCACAKASRA